MKLIFLDCKNLREVICLGWIDTLSRTYDVCEDLVGVEIENAPILLPIAHSTQNAQIELTVNLDGNIVGELTKAINEKNGRDEFTVIPVTEDSASRGNGNFPHPLYDKLCYVAGDYTAYTGDSKEEYFAAYIAGLEKWVMAEPDNAWIRAIYNYVKRGTLISDLVSLGLLKLDEDGFLSEKDYKIQQLSQGDAFVRFAVADEHKKVDLWKERELYDSYIRFYLQILERKELCYVSGRQAVCTEKHPSKIRNTADKAKLISGNDDSGFTYRGRFGTKGETVAVGYEISQKAHNALRWLLRRQGNVEDGRGVVVWKLLADDHEMQNENILSAIPNLFGDTTDAFSVELDEILKDLDATDVSKKADNKNTDVGQRYAGLVKRAMQGYANGLKYDDKVIMIAVDAATVGRLSVNDYHEFAGNEFIKRVIEWHENCTWERMVEVKDSGKYIQVVNAPSPREITLAAFGVQKGKGYLECEPELRKATIQRILPCIVGLSSKIPLDIVRAAVNRASNPQAYSSYVWENQVLAVACAMMKFNKFKSRKKEDEGMNQEQERAILFGKLLSIMDEIERKALYATNKELPDSRLTNAKKLWSTYVRRPMTTYSRLYEKMAQAYLEKLFGGTAEFLENEIQEVMIELESIDGFNNKPLKEEYLLGYYEQRNKIRSHKVNTTKNESDGEEGGNE